MAKNFPYFKFIVTEWMTGDIVYESFSVQGLFINICALYWQRDGILTLDEINKRYKNPIELKELTDRFFSVNDGFISVKFLDEQLIDANHISKTNTENGKKGGRPKGQQILDEKPTANRPLTDTKAKLTKEEEKKNKKERKEESNFNLFWELYDKKESRSVCEKKYNSLSLEIQELIIEVTPQYIAWKKDKQYRPNPLTFLNQKKWEDEIPGYVHAEKKLPKLENNEWNAQIATEV